MEAIKYKIKSYNAEACPLDESRHLALLIFLSTKSDEIINATPSPLRKSPMESGICTSGLMNKGTAIMNVPRNNSQRVCFFMIL